MKIIEVGAEEGVENNADNADPFGARSAPNPAAPQAPEDGNADDPFAPAPQEAAPQAANEPQEEVVEEVDDNVIDVEEVDGDVNTLMVLNTSGKPLYLMPGEVISGGKQDRTIGQEVVIASSDKLVRVDVFCVEHGRWGVRSVANTTAQLTEVAAFAGNLSLVVSQTDGVEELAKEAQRGKFVASVGQLNKDVRLAVQKSRVQGKVWEEVAKTNAKVGNASESGNFADNYISGEVAKNFEPFIEKLKPAGETRQIVGVAVAVNGKMLSVDVFESTPLFKKFWPKLLKSYALDAVAATSEEKSKEKPQAIVVEDCIAFLKDVEKSKTKPRNLPAVRRSRSGIVAGRKLFVLRCGSR